MMDPRDGERVRPLFGRAATGNLRTGISSAWILQREKTCLYEWTDETLYSLPWYLSLRRYTSMPYATAKPVAPFL